MNKHWIPTLTLVGCLTLLFTTGCPTVATPESAVTWGIKAATGQLTQATAGEWQALAQKIDELSPQADIPDLTDEQATAIVDFVQANDLNSIQDITDLVEQAQADPNVIQSLEIPESVMNLFGDVDFDSISDDIVG